MASSTWLGGEAALAHVHVVPVENGADGSSVDAEPITQLVGCRTGGVALDERLDLVGIELPCPPRFRPIGGRRSWCGGVGQLS
jgi:hypothetical protein